MAQLQVMVGSGFDARLGYQCFSSTSWLDLKSGLKNLDKIGDRDLVPGETSLDDITSVTWIGDDGREH